MICTKYNDDPGENSEPHPKPVQQPSRKAIGKQPLKDSFLSTLGE
jgi:hypothetical protein